MKIILEERSTNKDPALMPDNAETKQKIQVAISSTEGWLCDTELNNVYFYPFYNNASGWCGIFIELNKAGHLWVGQFSHVPNKNFEGPRRSIYVYEEGSLEATGKVYYRWGGQLKMEDTGDVNWERITNYRRHCIAAIKDKWKNAEFVDVFLTHEFK